MLQQNGIIFNMGRECILCTSKKTKVYQIISKVKLVELYHKKFNFDISSEIEDDFLNFHQCLNCDLRFFDPKFAGSGFFYEQLQIHRDVYYNPHRKEFYFAKEFLSKNDSVLEIGSGSGFFSKLIDCKEYIGLEYNDKAIAEAKKDNILLLKEDISSFAKVNEEKFDIVCSFHVLEHVKNPYEFIKSALACLKRGGKLILAIPCCDSIRTNNVNHVLNLPPHHLSRFFVKTLKHIPLIFNVSLESFRVDSIDDKINKKNYITDFLTDKFLAIFYPNNRLLIDESKLKSKRSMIHRINNKFKLYKKFDDSFVKGDNMTFIFTKK